MFGLIRPSHRQQASPSLVYSMIISPEFTCHSLGFISLTVELFDSVLSSAGCRALFLRGRSAADCGLRRSGLIGMPCGGASCAEVTGNHTDLQHFAVNCQEIRSALTSVARSVVQPIRGGLIASARVARYTGGMSVVTQAAPRKRTNMFEGTVEREATHVCVVFHVLTNTFLFISTSYPQPPGCWLENLCGVCYL